MTAPLPPVGEDQLVAWLEEHWGSFTEEALMGRLLEAGHPATEVDAAFARLRADATGQAAATAGVPPSGPEASSRPSAAGPPHPADALLGFLGTALVIVGVPLVLAQAGNANLAFYVVLSGLVAGFVAWAIVREGGRPGLARGIGAALILIVLFPVVAFIALFGYCLVASRMH